MVLLLRVFRSAFLFNAARPQVARPRRPITPTPVPLAPVLTIMITTVTFAITTAYHRLRSNRRRFVELVRALRYTGERRVFFVVRTFGASPHLIEEGQRFRCPAQLRASPQRRVERYHVRFRKIVLWVAHLRQ